MGQLRVDHFMDHGIKSLTEWLPPAHPLKLLAGPWENPLRGNFCFVLLLSTYHLVFSLSIEYVCLYGS